MDEETKRFKIVVFGLNFCDFFNMGNFYEDIELKSRKFVNENFGRALLWTCISGRALPNQFSIPLYKLPSVY